ncbi:MAG TPA: VOC family protein [Polyangiaceae bacterium]
MIQKLSHVSVFVSDQDRAKAFYTEKLGFEVKNDQTMGNFRWLTVAPKGQTELEVVLMKIGAGPHLDEQTAETIRKLVERGTFGAGVMQTADIQKTYEELKSKGVEFIQPPAERPYGIEALFRDDSGNWFSLCQRR